MLGELPEHVVFSEHLHESVESRRMPVYQGVLVQVSETRVDYEVSVGHSETHVRRHEIHRTSFDFYSGEIAGVSCTTEPGHRGTT